jgi:uncharacterized repeat protein (TIGR02543 family)
MGVDLMKMFKMSWLALAVLLPVLALSLTAAPAGAGCCGTGGPPAVTHIFRMYVSPDGGGDVMVGERLPGDYPYVKIIDEGTTLYFEAIPADGYYFVGWNGDLSGEENPTEVTIDAETNITAHFFPEEIASADNHLHIFFREGTVVQDSNGATLFDIELAVAGATPPPPPDEEIVGEAYELGPHGATFDHPATLNFSYDPDEIPSGVAEEDLVLGYYDDEAGEWLVLRSSVDLSSDTISTHFDHLSTFAVIAPLPPQPADFTASELNISPQETDIGETVTVSVLVTNAGELEGSYNVNLVVNGTLVETRELILAGGSQEVVFTTSGDEAGSYSVEVNGLEGSFTVREAPVISTGVSGGIIWTIVGLIFAALMVVAIILIIFKMMRRRRYDDYYYY